MTSVFFAGLIGASVGVLIVQFSWCVACQILGDPDSMTVPSLARQADRHHLAMKSLHGALESINEEQQALDLAFQVDRVGFARRVADLERIVANLGSDLHWLSEAIEDEPSELPWPTKDSQ